MRNALESIGNRADQMEDIINDLKDRNLEMTQTEKRENTKSQWMKEFYKDYLIALGREK